MYVRQEHFYSNKLPGTSEVVLCCLNDRIKRKCICKPWTERWCCWTKTRL